MPFRSALEEPTLDRFLLRDAVRGYALTPLQYEPGTKHVYSNAGINTAGRIIEVVSGMSYEGFFIATSGRFAPPFPGMMDTTAAARSRGADASGWRSSYRQTDKGRQGDLGAFSDRSRQLAQPLTDPQRQPVPAGGLFSTAKNVAAFGQMILRGGNIR